MSLPIEFYGIISGSKNILNKPVKHILVCNFIHNPLKIELKHQTDLLQGGLLFF